jgi:hypothetical protein
MLRSRSAVQHGKPGSSGAQHAEPAAKAAGERTRNSGKGSRIQTARRGRTSSAAKITSNVRVFHFMDFLPLFNIESIDDGDDDNEIEST